MSFRSIAWIETAIVIAGLAAIAIPAQAQRGGGRGAAAGAATTGAPRPVDITAKNSFDMASVDRGGKTFAAQCASCHGNARRHRHENGCGFAARKSS